MLQSCIYIIYSTSACKCRDGKNLQIHTCPAYRGDLKSKKNTLRNLKSLFLPPEDPVITISGLVELFQSWTGWLCILSAFPNRFIGQNSIYNQTAKRVAQLWQYCKQLYWNIVYNKCTYYTTCGIIFYMILHCKKVF